MDIYPAFEVALAVTTFVLGFVSARHHAQLSAARQLIASMDDAVGGRGGTSSRDQVADLVELASSGFRPDVIVYASVAAAVIVSVVITMLGLMAPERGWVDPAGAGTAKVLVAVGLAWMVTVLGAADAAAVRSGLDALRDRTTVGQLSQAESSTRRDAFDDAVMHATLAITRSPSSALAYLARARARIEAFELECEDGEASTGTPTWAWRDVDIAVQLDPALVAGMLDWIVPAGSAELPESVMRAWVPGPPPAHLVAPLRRRIMSHVHGAVRRDVLGRSGQEDHWTAAECVRRIGNDIISEPGVALLRMSRHGKHGEASLKARTLLGSPRPGDVLAAAHVLLSLGQAPETDPLAHAVFPSGHPWRTWHCITRAGWLELCGDAAAADVVLQEDVSDLALLRRALLPQSSAS